MSHIHLLRPAQMVWRSSTKIGCAVAQNSCHVSEGGPHFVPSLLWSAWSWGVGWVTSCSIICATRVWIAPPWTNGRNCTHTHNKDTCGFLCKHRQPCKLNNIVLCSSISCCGLPSTYGSPVPVHLACAGCYLCVPLRSRGQCHHRVCPEREGPLIGASMDHYFLAENNARPM
jgi:hypothetical protein